MLYTFLSSAQVNCIILKDTIGCAPFTVNVEYCGPVKDDGSRFPIFYNYEPGINVVQESYRYENAGIYDLRQVIAINEGDNQGIFDSTFKDAFRIVSNPEVIFELTPCHAKSLSIRVDSSSYDYYAITNNLNTNTDTIRGFGDLSLDFSAFSESEVEITITGKYDNAPCSDTRTSTSPLIGNMLPLNISLLSEYESPDIEFLSSGPFFYDLILSSNGEILNTKSWKDAVVTSPFKENTPDYENVKFKVTDACGTSIDIFETPTFRSETNFENNRNVVSETSPSFNPIGFDVMKDTIGGFKKISSDIDLNIVCNDTNCYNLRTERSLNGYSFPHISTGNCGKSFSIDIPPHLENYSLDNSIEDSLVISTPSSNLFQTFEVNSNEYPVTDKGFIQLPFGEECINLRFLNTCDVWSSDTTLCPLILNHLDNSSLTWNSSGNENYSVLWQNTNTTDTLFLNALPNQGFSTKDYPAQEFCIFLLSEPSNSISNQLCYESETFVFIPDISTRGTELNLKNRFLSTYTLKLFDLNGNLALELNENNKILSGIEPATYFYILQGESEAGDQIERKGTLIIK